eukprot:m.297860 g.297860  ORF g.297860 m.297860 type:complete len:321 (-) comp20088_c2_seq3:1483-2445(-)
MSETSPKRWANILLRLRRPIMLAPMAFLSTSKLVAAASNAGILGMHGAGGLSAEALASDIDNIRQRLSDETFPFGVNLMSTTVTAQYLEATASKERTRRAVVHVEPWYSSHVGAESNVHDVARGAQTACTTASLTSTFSACIDVILDKKVPVLSVIFGTLPRETVEALQRNGTVVVGTATCVDEALVLEELGFDAVVAQGAEAGGHRGSFLDHATLVGTMSLVLYMQASAPPLVSITCELSDFLLVLLWNSTVIPQQCDVIGCHCALPHHVNTDSTNRRQRLHSCDCCWRDFRWAGRGSSHVLGCFRSSNGYGIYPLRRV